LLRYRKRHGGCGDASEIEQLPDLAGFLKVASRP
jgi:hypothetical protein